MFDEGIYCETKNTSIGTGHTASRRESRFFYACLRHGEDSAVMILLNEEDKLKPTPFKEVVPSGRIESLQYISKLQPFFDRMRPDLEKARSGFKAATAIAPKPAPPAPKQIAPATAAAQPAVKPAAKKEEPKKDGMAWWEFTTGGSSNLLK